MTAPVKRTSALAETGLMKARTQKLEVNLVTEDGEGFLPFAFTQWQTDNAFAGELVSSDGTHPSNYDLKTVAKITGNRIASVWFEFQAGELFSGFNPGTGTQYLITLPSFDWTNDPDTGGLQGRYVPAPPLTGGSSTNNPPIGFAESHDFSSGAQIQLALRVSKLLPVPPDGAGFSPTYLEAYDVASGSLLGPSYPYAWDTFDDLIIGGYVTWPTEISLLDAAYPKPNPNPFY